MAAYLGDYVSGGTVHFMWNTNDVGGASVTRATDGEVRVYKDDSTTQTTTGVTDTEDFDSLTGVHHAKIALTDAFYAAGHDYMVVLQGAVVDGKTINAVLAHFSIENRFGADATEIADAVLTRDWTSVTGEAARSVLNALRFLRNKWSVASGVLTVTEEDDSTPAWTSAVSTTAGASPITSSDPN